MNRLKKTPLYEEHLKLKAKMVEFHGWLLPLQYSGILAEHNAVRNAAGLFDVSHMGEISVKGEGSEASLQCILTNDISAMAPGRALYSPMCYPDGGIVDDLLVYKLDEESYMLVVNAANVERDRQWLLLHASGAKIEDISDRYAQLALQGPNSLEILQRLTPQPVNEIGFFRFKSNVSIGSASALLSRTGYTGEDGFEIYLDAAEAPTLWQRLLDAGSSLGLVPAGLGARDTLRFEACLPLYGNELSEKVTPLEAGLDRFVKFNKDFIGKEALWAQKEGGVRRRIAGLELLDPGVPRQGYEVRADGKAVGVVTSGNFAPYLKKYLALALLNSDFSREGQKLLVSIRGKEHRATVVPTPFYRRSGKV